MKASSKVLPITLILFLFLPVTLNGSDRWDVFNNSRIISIVTNKLLDFSPLVMAMIEEEPVDGGHVGEVSITCSGNEYGRCWVIGLETCEYDLYSETTLEAVCNWTGSEDYYCPAWLVKVCNYIFKPINW